jgi:hypothetical protein
MGQISLGINQLCSNRLRVQIISHKTSSQISHNLKNFNCVVDVEKENRGYPFLTKRLTENILIVIVPALVKTS